MFYFGFICVHITMARYLIEYLVLVIVGTDANDVNLRHQCDIDGPRKHRCLAALNVAYKLQISEHWQQGVLQY